MATSPTRNSRDALERISEPGEMCQAFRIHRDADRFTAGLTRLAVDQLTEGDVLVDVLWSGINYKDALAATGKGRILRVPELNGGIDLAGTVRRSNNDRFKAGDPVFCCGAGLSEYFDGGYAEVARLPARCLRPLPEGLTLRDTMAIGTAGLTAMIAIERMEANGQPKDRGPILVTGASGGVGTIAINLLHALGYDVTASSGKSDTADYLRSLGANDVVGRYHDTGDAVPLERGQWAGAIDSVGGQTLSWLCRTVKPWGNIACVGLAGGARLDTTVMPLILRGVSLLGINSIELPPALLDRCWQRLATELKPPDLDRIAQREVTLEELPGAFGAYLAGKITGRTVVRVGKPA